MSKRTFQPNNRRRHKTHGFRLRMRTRAGRAILVRPPPQGPHPAGCLTPPARSLPRRRIREIDEPVLHAVHRLRRSDDFARATTHGAAGQDAHRCRASACRPTRWPSVRPRVGFVVSRAVGPAVVRNRVKRRLRHLMRDRLDQLGAGTCAVVVRALLPPPARDFHRAPADLDDALAGLGGRGARR